MFSPWFLVDVRIQMVMPPFSTLFANPAWKMVGNLGPFLSPFLRNQLYYQFIFLLCPWPLLTTLLAFAHIVFRIYLIITTELDLEIVQKLRFAFRMSVFLDLGWPAFLFFGIGTFLFDFFRNPMIMIIVVGSVVTEIMIYIENGYWYSNNTYKYSFYLTLFFLGSIISI